MSATAPARGISPTAVSCRAYGQTDRLTLAMTRSWLRRSAATVALGAMLAAGSAASANAAPVPSIRVAGVRAVDVSVVVAPASQYAVTVVNVGDQATIASEDDPSSIAIEGAGAGASVSGAGLQCTPTTTRSIACSIPRFALNPGDAVVVTVDGVNPDAGGGAIFTVTADFNGSISSVDVCTTAATDDRSDAGAASVPGQANSPSKKRKAHKASAKTSPALKTRRSVRARTVTVTVAHARGATGRLTVTAEEGRVRDWPDARRTVKALKVTRRKIAGRYRYSFTVRGGAYTVVARWVGTGHWADETQTTTYRVA